MQTLIQIIWKALHCSPNNKLI